MTTLEQVVLQNTPGMGFSVDALQRLRSFPKVIQVDGRDLQGNGRFAEVVIHFAEHGLAEKFVALAEQHFGDEVKRVD